MVLWLRSTPANHVLPTYHSQKIQMPKGESTWPTGVRRLPSGQRKAKHLEWVSHKDYTCWAKGSFSMGDWNAVSKRRGNGCWAGKNNRCPLQQVCSVCLWWAKRPETVQRHMHHIHTTHNSILCRFLEQVCLRVDWLYSTLILFLLFRTMSTSLQPHSFCPVSHTTYLLLLGYFPQTQSTKCPILLHSYHWINNTNGAKDRSIMHTFEKKIVLNYLPLFLVGDKTRFIFVQQWSILLVIFHPEYNISYIFPLIVF